MNQQTYGVWGEFFDADANFALDYHVLAQHAAIEKNVFLGRLNLDISLDSQRNNSELDVWCESEQGQRLLTALAHDLIWHIKSVGHFALPAHDLHQIFAKDTVEALRFAAMEKPQGYKAAFPIAAMGHDIGRLLEGRLYHHEHPYRDWIPHAQLSYIMLEKILNQNTYQAMPAELKAHLLYAVLEHSGPNTKTYIARATQVCDRWSGLHGPEGFFRAVMFVPHIMRGMVGYPVDKKYCDELPTYNQLPSAMMVLEFFARNMYPDVGDSHFYHRERMMVENIALLLKYCEEIPDIHHVMFAPEIGMDVTGTSHKKPLDMDVLDAAQDIARKYPYDKTAISAYDLTADFCTEAVRPVGAMAISDDMRRYLQTSFGTMEPAERVAFHNTLRMAQDLRQQACNRDWDVVAKALRSDNPVCRLIAQESTNFMTDSTRENHNHYNFAQGFRANTLG